MQDAVDKLYDFRDHFFERNSIDRASHKDEEVKQELQKTLALFDELQGINYYLYLDKTVFVTVLIS